MTLTGLDLMVILLPLSPECSEIKDMSHYVWWIHTYSTTSLLLSVGEEELRGSGGCRASPFVSLVLLSPRDRGQHTSGRV